MVVSGVVMVVSGVVMVIMAMMMNASNHTKQVFIGIPTY